MVAKDPLSNFSRPRTQHNFKRDLRTKPSLRLHWFWDTWLGKIFFISRIPKFQMFDPFFHSGLINIFFPVSPLINRFPSSSTSVSAVCAVSTSPEKDFQIDAKLMAPSANQRSIFLISIWRSAWASYINTVDNFEFSITRLTESKCSWINPLINNKKGHILDLSYLKISKLIVFQTFRSNRERIYDQAIHKSKMTNVIKGPFSLNRNWVKNRISVRGCTGSFTKPQLNLNLHFRKIGNFLRVD